MNVSCADLDVEQSRLCAAIERLHTQWDTADMRDAVSPLAEATTQAKEVLARLAPALDAYSLPVRLQLRGLRALVGCAQEELERAEHYALRAIGRRLIQKAPSRSPRALNTVFPAGTILSCPSCEEGLYKVMARATTEDLVMDDGTLVVPLNQSIPSRAAWTSLSCPFCGGRLFQDGQIHTFQYGWR